MLTYAHTLYKVSMDSYNFIIISLCLIHSIPIVSEAKLSMQKNRHD